MELGTKASVKPDTGHITELDSIRGIAAILIAIYHTPKWNPALNGRIMENFYLMVDLFFVLSGFVIGHSYLTRIKTGKDLLKFECLRVGRLYPVHLTMLGVFIVIEIVKHVGEIKYGMRQGVDAVLFTPKGPSALLEQVTLLQSVIPGVNSYTFNIPAWSISVEFWTYLVFASVVLCFPRKSMAVFFFLCIATLGVLIPYQQNLDGNMAADLRCLCGFSLGVLISGKELDRIFKDVNTKPSGIVIGIPLCSMLVYLCLKPVKHYDWAMFILAAAMIISIRFSKDGAVKGILRSKQLTFLGTISYSLYMTHAAAVFAMNQLVRFGLRRPEKAVYGINYPQLENGEFVLVMIVMLASIVGLGSAIYFSVEKPSRLWSRKWVASL